MIDVDLPAPGPELLAGLTADDIVKLRDNDGKEYFAFLNGQGNLHGVPRKQAFAEVLTAYWGRIVDHLCTRFPDATMERTSLGIKISDVMDLGAASRKPLREIAVTLLTKQPIVGKLVAPQIDRAVERLVARLSYKPTDDMQRVRGAIPPARVRARGQAMLWSSDTHVG